jgi:hypothetical protein
MRRLASLLVASVLVAVPSCERSGLHTVAAGTGGMTDLGGATATQATSAPGGALSTGGSFAPTRRTRLGWHFCQLRWRSFDQGQPVRPLQVRVRGPAFA